MYEFQFNLTQEEEKTIIKRRVKKEKTPASKKEKTGLMTIVFYIYFWGILITMGQTLCSLAKMAYGWPGVFIVLFMIVAVAMPFFEKGRYIIELAKMIWGRRKNKEWACLQLKMTDTQVIYGGEMETKYVSWSQFQSIGRFENLVTLWGEKARVYIPVRVIGTEEEIQELFRYSRECMDRGRLETTDMKQSWEMYARISSYCYYVKRTREEAAEECTQARPKPLISREYWTPYTIFNWAVALLVTVFFCGLTRKRIVWGIVVCLYLWVIGMRIRWGRADIWKKLLLKKGDSTIEQMTQESIIAFQDEGITTVTAFSINEYSWGGIEQVKEFESCLEFMLYNNYVLLLPTKVFESPAEKQQLIEYCSRKIKQK